MCVGYSDGYFEKRIFGYIRIFSLFKKEVKEREIVSKCFVLKNIRAIQDERHLF
uniref:Uncharacterized protein n=1 Tax=Romanomermis culicivorax TaxID=13658 RepID=A0A915I8Z4_ROMCU